jgi:hypothetical protein
LSIWSLPEVVGVVVQVTRFFLLAVAALAAF